MLPMHIRTGLYVQKHRVCRNKVATQKSFEAYPTNIARKNKCTILQFKIPNWKVTVQHLKDK